MTSSEEEGKDEGKYEGKDEEYQGAGDSGVAAAASTASANQTAVITHTAVLPNNLSLVRAESLETGPAFSHKLVTLKRQRQDDYSANYYAKYNAKRRELISSPMKCRTCGSVWKAGTVSLGSVQCYMSKCKLKDKPCASNQKFQSALEQRSDDVDEHPMRMMPYTVKQMVHGFKCTRGNDCICSTRMRGGARLCRAPLPDAVLPSLRKARPSLSLSAKNGPERGATEGQRHA